MKYPNDYINKVICGNCIEVMKQMPDKSVDLVVTDPPYGMGYITNHRKYPSDIIVPIIGDAGFDERFHGEISNELHRLMKIDTHIYVFCNDIAWGDFRKCYGSDFRTKRMLVWEKNNWTAGDLKGDYGVKTELVYYGNKGNRKLNGRRDHNVLHYDKILSELHPSEKPVDLLGFLIGKSSSSGQVILDPFLGSGTTAVACQQLGRKFIGIEINPDYCKIAERRLSQMELFSE